MRPIPDDTTIKSSKPSYENGKQWKYVTNKTQSQLEACEWTCSAGKTAYGTGCIPILHACT